jgi:uncharacterized membrane protein
MKNFLRHIQSYIVRGFFAMIPLFLCVIAIQLLYNLIDKKMIGFLNRFFEIRHIPGLGILLLLLSLYFIGMVVSNIIGRKLFGLIEAVTNKIPFIKTVYGVGKQVSQSLSITGEDAKTFKKAVLVNVDSNSNLWTPAFVTGELYNHKTKENMIMVFIPTVPNPVTGFIFAVRPSQIFDPGWTIEECLKAIVSAGILTPKEAGK